MQISLADYSAYLHELVADWSILRSISGWFLNFKSFCQMPWWTYPILPHLRCQCHTTQSCQSIELLVYMRNYQHLKTYYIWAVSLYEKLSTPQNLLHLKQSFGEIPGDDCRLQSNVSDRIEQPALLFLVLYLILYLQWSASGKPWSATDDAAEATNNFVHCFLIYNTV